MTAHTIVQKRTPYLITNSASGDFGILDGEFNVVERGIERLDDAIAITKRLLIESEKPPEPTYTHPEKEVEVKLEAEDESPEDELLEED